MPSGFCLRAQLLLGQGYQNYRAKVEIRGSWYKMHQATTGRQHRRNGQQTRAKWLDLLYCSQTEVPMHLTKGWENVQAGCTSTKDSGKCSSGLSQHSNGLLLGAGVMAGTLVLRTLLAIRQSISNPSSCMDQETRSRVIIRRAFWSASSW